MQNEIKKFGIVAGIAWGAISFILWKKHGNIIFLYLLVFSAFLFITSLIKPQLLKPIFKIWMAFGHLMGGVIGRLVLGGIFFLVLTPLGLMMKIIGKDFLNFRREVNAGTYWREKEKSDYETQF